MDNRWTTGERFEGKDLSGDYLNVNYAQAVKAGAGVDAPKDCGHVTCGLLCDVLLRQVRARRKGHQGR